MSDLPEKISLRVDSDQKIVRGPAYLLSFHKRAMDEMAHRDNVVWVGNRTYILHRDVKTRGKDQRDIEYRAAA